jgi:DNA-binding PadR family transcriptional regulator
MFFLQPCLLALLHRESGYGYSLMNGLQDFGFQSEAMDINILYRALRGLEAAGLVSS